MDGNTGASNKKLIPPALILPNTSTSTTTNTNTNNNNMDQSTDSNLGGISLKSDSHSPKPSPSANSSTMSFTSLLRKHSYGDLMSRFKSRKILGVGQSGSNPRGEIYRSKISQLLGHSDYLCQQFNGSIWHWWSASIFIHFCLAFWNILGRNILYYYVNSQMNQMERLKQLIDFVDSSFEAGICHLLFAIILLHFYKLADRSLARFVLGLQLGISMARICVMLLKHHCYFMHLLDLNPAHLFSCTTPQSHHQYHITLECHIHLLLDLLLVFISALCRFLLGTTAGTPSGSAANGQCGVSSSLWRRILCPFGGGSCETQPRRRMRSASSENE